MTDTPRNQKLWKALLSAQKAIGAVGKGSRNEFASYDYTSAEDMYAHCRTALIDNGIVVRPGDAHLQTLEGVDGQHLSVEFFATHAESGETERFFYSMPLVSSNRQPLDKIILGVRTTLLSYFLRDLLLVPRKDPNEIDARPPTAAEEESRAANAQRPATKKPASGSQQARATAALKQWLGDGATMRPVLLQIKADAGVDPEKPQAKMTAADYRKIADYVEGRIEAGVGYAAPEEGGDEPE